VTLTITDRAMRSPDTLHTARPDGDGWAVTWLPGRNLTRSQANAAMVLAESVGRIPLDAGPEAYSDSFWNHVNVLAAELGLTGPDAVVLASMPPS